MSLRVADGDELISTPVPFCRLITATATLDSMSVTRSGEQLTFGFDQGVRLTYRLSIGRGYVAAEVVSLEGVDPRAVSTLRLADVSLSLSPLARRADSLVAAWDERVAVALMPTHLAVRPIERLETGGGGATCRLMAETSSAFGILPAGCGLVACSTAEFMSAVAAFERAAGLPSPRPGGAPGKESVASRRSYLFIRRLHEADTPHVAAWARRGGMGSVLIGGSWSRTAGHHEVDTRFFPEGVTSLSRAVRTLHDAGPAVGLHLLGAAVHVADPYVTPKPDPRLVKNARGTLASDLAKDATTIPLTAPPTGFPPSDGGYRGDGTTVQVGDEIIAYGGISTDPPFGLLHCERGAHGTKVSAHSVGAEVAHLQRSYGYYLHDLDSTLADEVLGRVCAVADSTNIDMLYIDGSERLQGEQWYYNGKLLEKYYKGLKNPNVFLQASAWSPWSWHHISRMASADGHGDVKGYLDERTPSFARYRDHFMAIDCGWYYLYDRKVTVDQFDYILQRCLGFDASISLQTDPHQLQTHPEAPAIFDLINLYERVRLSGTVDDTTKELLREPKREYRTVLEPLRLQRVHFGDWLSLDLAVPGERHQVIEPMFAGARVGLQLRCLELLKPGNQFTSPDAVVLERAHGLGPFGGRPGAATIEGAELGITSGTAVAHRLGTVRDGPAHKPALRYQATSTLHSPQGWSTFGTTFSVPKNLSGHGGLGVWLRGNGRGGTFKIQLGDGDGAIDYTISNDFKTWRYVQFARGSARESASPDDRRITRLSYFWNGLPPRGTVTMDIGPIVSLPELDRGEVVAPTLSLGGKTITFDVTLAQDERLVWFPGETPYVVPAKQGATRPVPPVEDLSLTATAEVQIGATKPYHTLAEWRVVQVGSETISLPEEALATQLPTWRA